MISIAEPIIENEEILAVNEVLKSGKLAQGAKVAELEELFAKYCGVKYAVALNSGTAAIHCALFAAGVQPGDEVITTPFSFIATINPIIMMGAEPVLVDIEASTFNIDATKVEAAITSKTKAIIAVDLYGQPADYEQLAKIASKHGIKVIEDSCQSVGAVFQDKKTGSLADIGCFSLYATKNIMCGEGGMLTTNDEAHVAAVKKYRQHGMVAPYQYDGIGYNYRLTDLQAAIAVEQVKKIDRFNGERIDNAHRLNDLLAGVKGIILPSETPNRSHVYHQYTIRVTGDAAVRRDELVDQLRAMDIGAGVYYPKSLHDYDHIAQYGYRHGDFPVAEQLADEVVSLPVHPRLSADDIASIASAVSSVCAGKK